MTVIDGLVVCQVCDADQHCIVCLSRGLVPASFAIAYVLTGLSNLYSGDIDEWLAELRALQSAHGLKPEY